MLRPILLLLAKARTHAPSPPLLCLQDEQFVGAGLGTPNFTLVARELSHAGVAVGQREGFEFFGLGIEAKDRVRASSR